MYNWGSILEEIKSRQRPQDPSPHDSIRREFLAKLNEITERDVILYSSGWTHMEMPSARFSITDADLHGLMEVFYGLEGNELDLILHSPGGTPTAAESLVDYIHSKFENVRIFVPHAAMSAATMMCCSANELVMGRHSFLGPIDPQITLDTPAGYRSVPAQAILQQFEQAQEEIEEDQDNLAHWTPILRQYGPGLIVECKQAKNLSEELAREWAAKYMFSTYEDAHDRAENLASTLADFDLFKSHGRHINRSRAREYGFEVTDLENNQEVQDMVLAIYHSATLTHVQTGVTKIIENHNQNAFLQGQPPKDQEAQQNQAALQYPSTPTPPAGPPQERQSEEE